MTERARLLPLLIEPVVRMALLEDLGRAGDITSDAVIPADMRAEALLVSREHGVLAGLDVAALAFRLIDPALSVELWPTTARASHPAPRSRACTGRRGRCSRRADGAQLPLPPLGHRLATRGLVDALAGPRARIVCTRKTTPGLRALEKYAVRVGGGANHRFGLDDAMLIKDNHVALAGGIRPALERARATPATW